MKPSARIQAVIDILEINDNINLPLDSCLGDYMRKRRYIGSKDRSNIVDRIYNIIRHSARINWWINHLSVKNSPRNKVICWLILSEKITLNKLHSLFNGAKYSPEKLSLEEIKIANKLNGHNIEHKDMSETIIVECPPQFEEKLRQYFKDNFKNEMLEMLKPATLDIRTNIFATNREDVQKSLLKDNIETTITPFSPWGLRCKNKAYLSKTKAMNKGWIEIQDEGSQLIAYICNAKSGMQVLDYCAGGGGKTLALAAAMNKKGRIVAMDIDEKRLEKGRKRYKKAGISDIIEMRPLSDPRHKKWFKRQKETFDIVLIDAPCSGTGTWRRNPDMKWNSYAPPLSELIETQSDILEKLARKVKIGGKLIYATCSLLNEENEEQIEKFLKKHNEFKIQPINENMGIGTPFMKLTPYKHKTDGFFAAILERI